MSFREINEKADSQPQANGSNRLAALAADIRAAHATITESAEVMAERALAAGAWLIEAKETLPHGAWEPWLARSVGISARTARRYMQLSRAGLKAATVADLGIRGAAEAIAQHREVPAEDFRDRLNDPNGWPMPPAGGHTLILTNLHSPDSLVGPDGYALVWPIAEADGVRYFDLFAIPAGSDRPATYLKRGGAASVIAAALDADGFTLTNCNCTVFNTPIDDEFRQRLAKWREEDRRHEWMRLAAIPEATFEEGIEVIKESGAELTAKGIPAYAAAHDATV